MAVVQVPRIVRVTFVYGLVNGTSVEDFAEHSLVYQAASVPTDPAVTDAILMDMADAALASQAANVAPNHWSPSIQCAHVRVALEGTDGKTLFEKIVQAVDDLAWVGTGSATSLPWSSSLCVSLYAYEPGTFSPFGKSQRGRFYLPPPSIDVLLADGTGEVNPTVSAGIRDQWAQVAKELQEHDYSGFPAFAPALVVNSRRLGEAFPVTFVRVDNKLDTQRRRSKQQLGVVSYAEYPST